MEQWFTSEEGNKINKGEKIGEKNESDKSKCCERCFSVAPTTNAGLFFEGRCVCFKVTGKESPHRGMKTLKTNVCFKTRAKFRFFLISWSKKYV